MELIGRGYLIEHIVAARRRIRERERFTNYIADGVFAISNRMALVDKYRDLYAKEDDKPEKTPEEIKDQFRRKFAGG